MTKYFEQCQWTILCNLMLNFHITYNYVNQEKIRCGQNEITCKHMLYLKITYKPEKKKK